MLSRSVRRYLERSLGFISLGLSIALSSIFISAAKSENLSPKSLIQAQITNLTRSIVDRNTNQSARISQFQAVRERIIPENFDLSLHPLPLAQNLLTNKSAKNDRDYWLDLLWKTGVAEPQRLYIAESLTEILRFATIPTNQTSIQPDIITAALRLAIQLYSSKSKVYQGLDTSLVQVANNSKNSTWVAMAVAGLAQRESLSTSDLITQISLKISQKFNFIDPVNLRLSTTLQSLYQISQPPLRDLLLAKIVANQPILFVICSSDRAQLCQAIVKDERGILLKEANGKLWSVSLFLQSLHRLPWNFTNGNTPQGIYRIEGLAPENLKTAKDLPTDQEFLAYGQFPLVKLFMPFETAVKEFLPGKKGTFKGSIQAYQALLPSSWRDYFPLQQSYWAGKLGRSFIRIHGTGFAPGYFWTDSQAIANPNWNPALGCISAQELYDSKGNIIKADMPKILDALRQVGKGKVTGYAVVVDLAPNQEPLTQINQAINLASNSASISTKGD